MNSKTKMIIAGLAIGTASIILNSGTSHGLAKFRHYQHVDGQGIACVDCHKEDRGTYELPDHETCNTCHASFFTSDTPTKDTCGHCHQLVDIEKEAKILEEKRPQKPKTSFVHTQKLHHICSTCHNAMLEEHIDPGRIRSKKDRDRIRKISHNFYFTPKCYTCHDDGRTMKDKPLSHDESWIKKGHKEDAPYFNCRICHEKTHCQSCHDSTY